MLRAVQTFDFDSGQLIYAGFHALNGFLSVSAYLTVR
jgi:hypothetical protein